MLRSFFSLISQENPSDNLRLPKSRENFSEEFFLTKKYKKSSCKWWWCSETFLMVSFLQDPWLGSFDFSPPDFHPKKPASPEVSGTDLSFLYYPGSAVTNWVHQQRKMDSPISPSQESQQQLWTSQGGPFLGGAFLFLWESDVFISKRRKSNLISMKTPFFVTKIQDDQLSST